MTNQTTRRAFIGSAGLIGVAIVGQIVSDASATNAPVSGSHEFRARLDTSDATRDRFNNLPHDVEATDPARHEREMIRLADATRRADRAIPTNWQEYTRLIEHMSDGGASAIDDDNATRLLDHARRLSRAGA